MSMSNLRLAVIWMLALVPQVPARRPPTNSVSDLYTASIHTFSVLRSGVAINDSVTGIRHAASHTQDAMLAGTSDHRDLTGGWYNAGDYGKWPNTTAIAVSYMLHLYEVEERAARSDRSSHPHDPELLQQARWGLTWMLKMQDVDGGVRQKVDGATQASLSAAWGKPPELDPNLRIAAAASTGSTADFAAVMYQAAQFFESKDRNRSRQCRAAADRAWEWIPEHPNVAANDLFYINHDFRGELLWARSEHALAYGMDSPVLAQQVAIRSEPEVSWLDPSLLGLYSLASSPTSLPHLRTAASTVIVQQAHALAKAASTRPFRVALGDGDYWWGSAERILHRAALLLIANELQPSPLLREAASDQLAWILGNNAANHSFVTSFGTNPVIHPWHWTYRNYGIVMPGWAVGGPNSSPEWADPALKALQERETPPSRCYVDLCDRGGSWASNEGQISEEAALVFVTGLLRGLPER